MDPIRLGAPCDQRVIAVLLLAEWQVVPIGRLVDSLWDDFISAGLTRAAVI